MKIILGKMHYLSHVIPVSGINFILASKLQPNSQSKFQGNKAQPDQSMIFSFTKTDCIPAENSQEYIDGGFYDENGKRSHGQESCNLRASLSERGGT
jgi:hypothetical protein